MKKRIIVSDSMVLELSEVGEYIIELAKPDVEISINGRFVASGIDQKQLRVTIHHRAPRTVARTSLRGTSNDQAKLSFFGRIIIDPNCPQTNSFLEERILLLSPNARGETVPELEILSDDVKCSHAATISTIDPEQLFYLQSRGLTFDQAEKMLVASFLQ
ncbi:SufD family Fe-S cluster assembly protein [Candidatus Woesebacteria bacterium]|nr:SufD family Fe-S cluster assembly protein [Candidatus Woesebacteria bacterium]